MKLLALSGLDEGGPLEWPARSPDLTPMDFWLWGYLKEKVYAHNPKTVDQLQVVIRNECTGPSNDSACYVISNYKVPETHRQLWTTT